MAALTVPSQPKALTIKVRFSPGVRARLWLSARLIGLAAVVAGCSAEVSVTDKHGDEAKL